MSKRRNFNRATEKPTETKKVDKQSVCTRCKGDGFWHSTKTGYRANTSTEPLIDRNRQCPKCKKDGEQ